MGWRQGSSRTRRWPGHIRHRDWPTPGNAAAKRADILDLFSLSSTAVRRACRTRRRRSRIVWLVLDIRPVPDPMLMTDARAESSGSRRTFRRRVHAEGTGQLTVPSTRTASHKKDLPEPTFSGASDSTRSRSSPVGAELPLGPGSRSCSRLCRQNQDRKRPARNRPEQRFSLHIAVLEPAELNESFANPPGK
jgi:hypothetical protein